MRAAGQTPLTPMVILALLTTSVAGVCGGWESSPEARMACCAMARHACKGEKADDCCAAGEGRQRGEASSATSTLAPPSLEATVSTADVITPRAWRLLEHSPDTHRSATVNRLLLCIFLI